MRWRDDNRELIIGLICAVILIIPLFFIAAPANSAVDLSNEGFGAIHKEDLPLMELGPKEAQMMKQWLMETGEYTYDKGHYYYIRTYDAGRAQPPGIDEYYHLTVHIIYVPAVAPGFNIGLEYELESGDQNEYGDHAVRKVIQYHLDDSNEDLSPDSMIRADLEFRYGAPIKTIYKPVDGFLEWRYWVYYWYSVFLNEGMK
jgi:hypothetical protein